jgi:hypothetical protein
LVHFTRAENVETIMQSGLLPTDVDWILRFDGSFGT